jgi:hypothetical protein
LFGLRLGNVWGNSALKIGLFGQYARTDIAAVFPKTRDFATRAFPQLDGELRAIWQARLLVPILVLSLEIADLVGRVERLRPPALGTERGNHEDLW